MALPFEVANFNLVNFADNYNAIFDSTPADVDIQVKDSNGNITTKTVANRGKFKQQLWDDVGGALGQFEKTVYVDTANGNDDNSGLSIDNAFLTLKKAIDSTPRGGSCSIKIRGDVEINESIILNGKSIVLYALDYDYDNSQATQTLSNNEQHDGRIASYEGVSYFRVVGFNVVCNRNLNGTNHWSTLFKNSQSVMYVQIGRWDRPFKLIVNYTAMNSETGFTQFVLKGAEIQTEQSEDIELVSVYGGGAALYLESAITDSSNGKISRPVHKTII